MCSVAANAMNKQLQTKKKASGAGLKMSNKISVLRNIMTFGTCSTNWRDRMYINDISWKSSNQETTSVISRGIMSKFI